MTAMLLGLFWGFIEATLGGALHFVKFPFTGEILGSIGFGLLYVALRKGIKPSQIAVIPIIAAAIKFIDAPLFHLPFTYPSIIRPAIAILMQGFAFVALLSWLKRPSWSARLLAPVVLAAVSICGFFTLFADFNIVNHLSRVLVMSIITGALFSVIYLSHSEKILSNLRPTLVYISSTVLMAVTISARLILH